MHVELWDDAAYCAMRIDSVGVDVERPTASLLRFRYIVQGDIDGLILPPPASPFRAKNLWQATCFEAFLKPVGSQAYRELNFSPSGQWAAYEFAAYREGMRDAAVPAAPDITLFSSGDQLELAVTISLDLLDDPYRLAVAAVLQEQEGISYWNTWHSSERPDFHHDACFSLQLPPATTS